MSNITYRLVKGQELTFTEIDENFSSLDSDIRGNRRYFDSQLEQFGLGRDSDFLAILAQRDSDAAAIILQGIANHDSDIADLNARSDSEHAWNIAEHAAGNAVVNDRIDSEHAWNVTEHGVLSDRLDSEHAWNIAEHGVLSDRLDSEHAWNIAENNDILSKIDSDISSLSNTVNGNVLTAGAGISISPANAIANTAPDQIVSITGTGSTTVAGTYPNFTIISSDTTYTAGSGMTLSGTQFINAAPDQTVAITGSGATTVTGTYPNFTVSSTDTNNNTTYTAGSGMTLTGTQFINAAPDRTVSLTGTGATTVTGTYPNFTISSTDTNNNTTYTAGSGMTLTGTQFINAAPDRTVAITGTGATTVTGTYPNFTVSSTDTNVNTTYTAGSGMTLSGTQFINAAPDRTVSITGSGSTTVTGTYPNFTVSSTSGGTYTAGNGLTLTGSEFTMSGSYTGTFTATGDVVAFSDMALKSEVTAIDEALDKLMSITGYTYNTKGSERRHSGVMAQDVEEVLPEVVHTSEDGTKGVAYGNMMGLVIEAIRELKTQVDELKGR